MIDLHIHSTASDGTLTPYLIAKKVTALGLYAFSLTDHDTTAGIPELLSSGLPKNIHFIPGIEISCDTPKHEIHILGYGIDWNNPPLNERLSWIRKGRLERNIHMATLFQKDGIPVTLEKLQNGNPNTVITRAHFSRVLIDEGICKTREQAFKKYLSENSRYYLPKPFLSPKDAISLIREAGGIPILAHPFLYKFSNLEIQQLIEELISYGLGGLEIYHSTHHAGQIAKLSQWQKNYQLLSSGGSDFHGENKPDIQIGRGRGNLNVPDHLYDILHEHL